MMPRQPAVTGRRESNLMPLAVNKHLNCPTMFRMEIRCIRLRGGSEDATGDALPSMQSSRLVVQLIVYKGAWVSRIVDSAEDSEVFFIRKSSMRDQSQWSKLQAGKRISLTIKRAAGRGIVSDAVLEA